MDFGDRVIAAMNEKGMTQMELARESGLSQQMLSKIVLKKTSDPRLSTAIAIAKALDVSLSYLGGWEDDS